MKRILLFLLAVLTFQTLPAATFQWTNTLGGSWNASANWFPNGVPSTTADLAYITNAGTYTVYLTNNSVDITVAAVTLGGNSGTPILIVDNSAALAPLNGIVTNGGVLVVSNASLSSGVFTVKAGGQLNFAGSSNVRLYSTIITNQGTVTWSSGSWSIGGTTIFNSGLWQITGNNASGYGGGGASVWVNAGTLRKSAGTGVSGVNAFNFLNQPSGVVDAQFGALSLAAGSTNLVAGIFTNSSVAAISLAAGTWTDAGGIFSGTGTNLFTAGTFNLQTNVPPGLKFTGGDLYITGTNSFQQGGAITNLTLDGATLHGTNFIGAGVLTFNGGSIPDKLVVQPAGHLVVGGTAGKLIYGLTLVNQGTVIHGGFLNIGGTTISNGGLWQIIGDYSLGYGGGSTPNFTNSGTLEKVSGTGSSAFTAMNFYNQTGALVQVDSGTLQLPASSTNFAGTLRLNGGTLNANGTFAVAGGTLDGAGAFGANAFSGGTISPGTNGAGLMAFSSGLNLNSNVTLVINGTGTVPGTSYDQLSVTGAVAISNCTLQVSAMPGVPAGTTFTIIANDGTDPIGGTFSGLPENSVVNVGAQTFRIHYAGGTGNDVTLVRDGVVVGPLLSLQGITNGTGYFSGSGAIPLTTFTVCASTNLATWTNIGVVTSSVSGAWNFTDTNAWRYQRRFYSTTN